MSVHNALYSQHQLDDGWDIFVFIFSCLTNSVYFTWKEKCLALAFEHLAGWHRSTGRLVWADLCSLLNRLIMYGAHYCGSDDTGARKTMRLMETGLKFQREREEAEGRISLAPWGGRHASPTGKLPGDDGYVRARREGRRAADSAGSLAKVNNGGETARILRRGLQAQGNSWEQNKKRQKLRFSCCAGRPFYWRPSAPEGEKKGKMPQSAQWRGLPLLCCQSLGPH